MRPLNRLIASLILLIAATPAFAFEIGVYQTGGSITNLNEALAAIANGNLVGSASYNTINFSDSHPNQGDGHFGGDVTPFPGGAETDFALHATGMFNIDTAGDWTFGVRHDDGVGVWIDGVQIINFAGLTDDRDSFGTVNLSNGMHELELVFFEHQGGAGVELFSAYGDFGSFNSNFQLTESDEVPIPAPLALLGLGALMMARRSRR